MSKRFDAQFDEPQQFFPEGLYVSRNIFPTKEEAALSFAQYYKEIGESDTVEPIPLEEIKEAYVRWQPMPSDLRDEVGDWGWIVCEKEKRGAQPCYMYGY